MSLHPPYFFLKETGTGTLVCHNCDGVIGFMATDHLDDRTKKLVLLAIEEGKRIKAREITEALYLQGLAR